MFRRPSQIFPALEFTETVEVTALVAPDKPGASDRLMLWISNPAIATTDESAGPKLNLADESSADEEGDRRTTTAPSRRWRRNSRPSAGTPTGRPGNNPIAARPRDAAPHLTCRAIAAMNRPCPRQALQDFSFDGAL